MTVDPQSTNRDDVLIDVRNQYGSREHYYHFLLGCLLPLLEWVYNHDPLMNKYNLIIQSCGPMDIHLKIFPENYIRVLSKESHARVFSSKHFRPVTLKGFDTPKKYPIEKIKHSSRILKKLLKMNVIHNLPFNSPEPLGIPHILLIERLTPSDQERALRTEARRAGAERRSIPNIKEIDSALKEFNSRVVHFELLDLACQKKLIEQASILIAQHGAALTNVILSDKKLYIIEIIPKNKLTEIQETGDYFGTLSILLGHSFERISQENDHAPVDTELIKRKVIEKVNTINFEDL